MNQYVTGTIIKNLREKYQLTQAELAAKLNLSNLAKNTLTSISDGMNWLI